MLISFSLFREAVENGIAHAEHRVMPHLVDAHKDPLEVVRPKRQTIRAERADGRVPRVGETAHLWWKSRTPEGFKLAELQITSVHPIRVGGWGKAQLQMKLPGQIMLIGGGDLPLEPDDHFYRLEDRTARALAKADGFKTAPDMIYFLEKAHGLPFAGWVIRW